MKKVLSVNGGGILGIIPSVVLVEIEKRTGKRTAEMFDLMAGTSTGGILALQCNIVDTETGKPLKSAEDVLSLYMDRGKDIFKRSLWYRLTSTNGWWKAKYHNKHIGSVLKDEFGDALVSQSYTNVMMPAYDVERRTPFFFKSWRYDEKNDYYMRHAAQATSAAPTYFSPIRVRSLGEGYEATLVDGGIGANDPSVCALAEARRLWPKEKTLFVSLGTGTNNKKIKTKKVNRGGLVKWAPHIFNAMMDSVEDMAAYQMDLLHPKNSFRFNREMDLLDAKMDDASDKSVRNIKLFAENMVSERSDEISRLCDILAQ